MLMQTWLYKNK